MSSWVSSAQKQVVNGINFTTEAAGMLLKDASSFKAIGKRQYAMLLICKVMIMRQVTSLCSGAKEWLVASGFVS
jgi:hypothetical protein